MTTVGASARQPEMDPAGLVGMESTIIYGRPTRQRRVSATLRARLRWFRERLDPLAYRGLRALPILLNASFDFPGLDGESPGVADLQRRLGWGRWISVFGLPPPRRLCSGKPGVSSIVVLPAGESGARVLIFTEVLSAQKERGLLDRVTTITELLKRAGLPLTLELASRNGPTWERLVPSILAFGALAAGTWPLVTGLEPRAGADALAELVLGAPSGGCFVALALGLSRGVNLPLAAMFHGEQEVPTCIARDPVRLCFAWAGRATGLERLARELLQLIDGAVSRSPGNVVLFGRELTVLCARGLRRMPSRWRAPLRQRFQQELVGSGLPPLLHPALLVALEGMCFADLVGVRAGKVYEVRLPEGVVLGRGLSEAHAYARALALLAPAIGRLEVPDRWQALAEQLAPSAASDRSVAVVEPSTVRGLPHDPINAGTERRLAFAGGMLVRHRGGRRPSARVLESRSLVELLLSDVRRGSRVEVRPSEPEARAVAERLTRLLAAVRGQPSMAAQVGGKVYVRSSGHARRFQVERFLARPRLCAVDPEAPDLAHGGRFGPRRTRPWITPFTIEVGVGWRDDQAQLLYMDAWGARFRETVPLSWLSAHLDDTGALLRPGRGLLAVHSEPGLESALLGREPLFDSAEVKVSGTLPHRVSVEFGGERFGGGLALGWNAAAEALLAQWPSQSRARISIRAMKVKGQSGVALPHIVQLWVRSQVLRRLAGRLDRLWPYRPASR